MLLWCYQKRRERTGKDLQAWFCLAESVCHDQRKDPQPLAAFFTLLAPGCTVCAYSTLHSYINRLVPQVLWAQRPDTLFLTIALADVKDEVITLDENKLTFKGKADGKEYALEVEFFKAVIPAVTWPFF